MTPCEERGYKVGDRFRVAGDFVFTVGSTVELHKDDGSYAPLFKLISGHCRYNYDWPARPGAYTHIDNVEKIEMTETRQQKLERIERIEEELEALKRDVSEPERWESGVGVNVNINGPYPAIDKIARAAVIAAKGAKYVYDHEPHWDGSDPWFVYKINGIGRFIVTNTTRPDLGAVRGPRWVMENLAADLTSGRVVL